MLLALALFEPASVAFVDMMMTCYRLSSLHSVL